nr:TPA_asm: NADH dehydrogenase subunit 2 [Pseudomyrmex concolor]
MNFFSHMIMIPTLILFSVIPMMMSNMILIWFIMEISNFMFISFMITSMKQKKMIFMYFLVQITASFMLMFPLIVNYLSFHIHEQIILFLSLFMKTGVPPLHLWMPVISKFMPWLCIFFMLTTQKLSPMILFFLININKQVINLIIVLTMIVPPLCMINLKSIKMLITYSSINQTGWIVMLIYLKHQFWMLYFILYSTILFMISSIMKLNEMSMKFFSYTIKKFNLMFTAMMMNLASMPPFSFFLFKWFSTFTLIMNSNMKMIIIFMLTNSMMMTYIYIKMMMWSLFMNKFESKMISSFKIMNNTSYTLINLLIIITPIMFMI